jgi:hypothetical protein
VGSLREVLRATCGVRGGVVMAARQPGLVALSFPPGDGAVLLARAYRQPARTGPRAVRFVARFASQR